jgi:hypothetical protein
MIKATDDESWNRNELSDNEFMIALWGTCALQWREQFASQLKQSQDKSILVVDPTNEELDKTNKRRGMEWQSKYFDLTSTHVFYFNKESICAETLMELTKALYRRSNKRANVVIAIDTEYSRREALIYTIEEAMLYELDNGLSVEWIQSNDRTELLNELAQKVSSYYY